MRNINGCCITTKDNKVAMSFDRKRVAITGGAGFLGSHLCEKLLGAGQDVLCIDNFFTGSRDNIRHLLREPNFELLRHDITFPIFIEVDEIYNLACPASPVYYQYDPVQTTKTSVHGVINMLGLTKRVRARILQASTSEVYGDPEMHPQSEDYWGRVNPIGPRACYDEGKRCAETLFFDYYRQYKLDIKVARIFNTYGPRMHPNDGRVVSNFIVQALQNKPITIYGDGSQTRCFCAVQDTVEALVRLITCPKALGEVVNVGSDHEISIEHLARTIITLLNSSSTLEYVPYDVAYAPGFEDMDRRVPSSQRIQDLLGWEPKRTLDDILQAVIDCEKEQL